MTLIPINMHGTHERENGIRPIGLTKFAIKSGYRAFDIYNADRFRSEISYDSILRENFWLQIKDRLINSYSGNESFGTYLSLLKTDYVDSYAISYNEKHWTELENLYNSGEVKYLGLEHTPYETIKNLVENAKVKPVIIHGGLIHSSSIQYALENCIILQPFQVQDFFNRVKKDGLNEFAVKHNVSAKQIFLKLLTELGIQVLTGANSEKYLLENLSINFTLSPNEVKQIIKSGIFNDDSENMLLVYEKLQNGELVRLNDIYTRLTQCKFEQLADETEKLAKFIPKIDPTTLAEIMANQSPEIVDYLIQYNANFSQITNVAFAKIIHNYGIGYIDVLKEKLNIPAEQLLLSSLHHLERSYFNKLIDEADFSKINRNDILSIVKFYPDLFERFLNSNIFSEYLVVPAAFLNDKKAFDELLAKADLNKLYSRDIVQIICKFGLEVIDQLAQNNYNFLNLTITDIENLIKQFKLEVILKLAEYHVSPTILLPALKLGGIETFNQLASKLDISKLKSPECIKELIEQNPQTLNSIVVNEELLEIIFMFSNIFSLESLKKVLTSMAENVIKLTNYYIIKIIIKTINSNDKEFFEILIQQLDLNSLEDFDKLRLVEFSITDENKFEYIVKIADIIDLKTLDSYYKREIFLKLIDSKASYEYICKVADFINSKTLDSHYSSEIALKLINESNYELLAKIAEIINLKNPYCMRHIVNTLIGKDDYTALTKIAEIIDLRTLDSYFKINVVSQLIVSETDIKTLEDVDKIIDFSTLDLNDIRVIIDDTNGAIKDNHLDFLTRHIDSSKFLELSSIQILNFLVSARKSVNLENLVAKFNLVNHPNLNLNPDNPLADLNSMVQDREIFLEKLSECLRNAPCAANCITEKYFNTECVGKFISIHEEL